MVTNNPSLIVWQNGLPVLWRAGASSAVDLDNTVDLPEGTVVGVPSDSVRLTEIEVPADEVKHLRKSLPFTMEERVADDVDELHFVHEELGDGRFLVGLVQRELMAGWLEQLPGHDDLAVFTPEALCLPITDDTVSVLIDGDQGVLRWSPSAGCRIELSLLQTLLESLPGKPAKLVMYGVDQSVVAACLDEAWQAIVEWRQGSWGAALMLSEQSKLLNFRVGAFIPKLPLMHWWGVWQRVAVVVAIAVVIQLLADIGQYQRLKSENIELRTAIQQSYRKANPRGAMVDVEKQLDRQIGEFGGADTTMAFTPRLVAVISATVAEEGVVNSLNYASGQLRLNLTAGNFAAIERIRQRLSTEGFEATLETSTARGNEVRARLRVEAS
ncbi:MAG: hypothetical protein CNF01_00275 [Halieaceae bacterium MED-G27]|nr:hypothetical protein [Halieaceae bacterium]OUT65784.1 MAG: hypothetical protein CBB81_05980 [Cellvibrionales bacterium TMED21]PDH38736.1 MAG: hypothetical protein CNF01_00275 [Halieaceae bacterium MED-G27]